MELKEVMRRIVEEDKSILSRRDDFLAALDGASNSPRDFQTIKRAVTSTNICEMFFVNDGKDIGDKEDALKSIRDKLVNISTAEPKIDFIIDSFIYALNWETVKDDEAEETFEEETSEEPVAPVEAAPATEEVSLQKSWRCSCGADNFGNFCSACGKKRGVKAETSQAALDNMDKVLEETKVPSALVNQPIAPSTTVNMQQNPAIVQNSSVIAAQVEEMQLAYESMPSYESRDVRNDYLTFEGRVNRRAYIVLSLYILGAGLLALIPIGMVGAVSNGLGGLLAVLVYFALFIVGLSVNVRRCHDLNYSGWLVLATLIPYVNFLIGLYLLCAPGTKGPNRYGPDPLEF